MKALTVWQPWASLIAIGAKKYETRSWTTRYQGPLLICAAKGGLSRNELLKFAIKSPFFEILSDHMGFSFVGEFPGGRPHAWGRQIISKLPFGMAVAVVELIRCVRTEDFKKWIKWNKGDEELERELPLGDFSSGRYAWELANVRPLREPFPIRGQQGLFEVPDSLLEKVLSENHISKTEIWL